MRTGERPGYRVVWTAAAAAAQVVVIVRVGRRVSFQKTWTIFAHVRSSLRRPSNAQPLNNVAQTFGGTHTHTRTHAEFTRNTFSILIPCCLSMFACSLLCSIQQRGIETGYARRCVRA